MQCKIERSLQLVYKDGYKYQLQHPYFIQTPLRPEQFVTNGWVSLDVDGKMFFMPGYCWDGVTGAPDTESGMAGSLMHDGGYQLMREGLLPLSTKPLLDEFMAEIFRRDGMWALIAELFYLAVRKFGRRFATKPTTIIRLITR